MRYLSSLALASLVLLHGAFAQAGNAPPPLSADLGTKEDWKRHNFSDPDFHVLKSHQNRNDPKFTLSLRPVFVAIKGSRWTVPEIQEQFDLLGKTYSQCGLYIEDSPLIFARSPLGHATLNPDRKDDIQLAEHLPTNVRPLLFLDGKHKSVSLGFSYNADSFERDPNLNVAVLNVAYLDDTVIPRYDVIHANNYLDPGHELAHILLNAGHNRDEETNILTVDPPRFFNAHLTESQCRRLQSGPGVSPLKR